MSLELTPEEQKLQDTIDKIVDEIYSQIGIPRYEAESAVKTAIKSYDNFIQENLKEEK